MYISEDLKAVTQVALLHYANHFQFAQVKNSHPTLLVVDIELSKISRFVNA